MTRREMTKREMPAAFYAAAGAGDLAYQRLRKLPEAANRTLRGARQTAETLRERAASGELRFNRNRIATDLATLRESAQRGATAFVATAAAAQERAVTGYRTLVAHGEQVVAARTGMPLMEEPTGEPAVEPAVEPAAELGAAFEEMDEPVVEPGAEPEQPAPGEPVPPVKTKKAAARARKSTGPSTK